MEIHRSIYKLPSDATIVYHKIDGNTLTIDYSIPSDIKEDARKAIKEWASQPENASKILEMMAKSKKD